MPGTTENQLSAIEEVLASHLGPIGSITLMTQLKNLGLTREQLGPDDIQLLVDQIGEAISALIGDVKGKSVAEEMNDVLKGWDT
jgi:hypothetical protein